MQFFGVLNNGEARRIQVSKPVKRDLTSTLLEQWKLFEKRQTLAFDVNDRPDKDEEAFEIEPFELPEPLRWAIDNWQDCDPLKPALMVPGILKAVMAATVSDEDEIEQERGMNGAVFKGMNRYTILDRSVLRLMSDSKTFSRDDHPALVIPERVDAVYSNNALYFASYFVTKRFLDLSEHFKEASDEDINRFMDVGFLRFDGEGTVHDVLGQRARRKVSMLLSGGVMEQVSMADLKAHALEYEVGIRTHGEGEDEVVLVPEKSAEVNDLLDLLNQCFYRGGLDNERRRASAFRKV